METLNLLAGASATVLAAVIAAAITFLAAVFTKESKVSEFRQQWIDALRDDISELISVLCYLAHEYEQLSKNADASRVPIVLDRIKPEMMTIQRIHARIELRLNPEEHDELLDILGDFVKVPEFAAKSASDETVAIRKVINEAQKVLKAEWRVVKKGETTYRWVKRLSLLALVAAVFAFALVVF
jgi:hypothetical protein